MEATADIIWRGVFGSLGFGFIGFLVALVLLFIVKSSGLLARTRKISKFLVITYWIFIPVLFGCGFMALKALVYAESRAKNLADSAIEVFEEKTFPSFHKYVTENLEQYTGESIIPSNEEIVENFYEEENTETNWITRQILVFFLELLEEEAEKRVAGGTGVSQENVHSVRLLSSGSIDELFHSAFGRMSSMARSWIGGFFTPYYFVVIGYWILFMIFPVTEILIARKRRKRHAKTVDVNRIPDL